ncbi:MAG: putative toxin-antitoxin system toxin component, PIN family [Candidatus Brocadiales bacterium]|nr:putative toxin-antitoxin system toxin component, PIN family [Candidatus Brocadiales bacterium]
MKVILDTNVVMSGIFFSGPPYQIMDAWRCGQLDLVLSKEIYQEYHRVAKILNKKYPVVNIHSILELIVHKAELISSIPFDTQVCEDPDDDMFLECASSANVKMIVSGDKHLLDVSGFQGIEVIKPADFAIKYLKKNA